jgi:hypothetical protein
MAVQYWATLSCNGTGTVPSKIVNAGASADFDGIAYNLQFGGTVSCKICFDKLGSSEPPTCVNAGTYEPPPICTCDTIQNDPVLSSSSSCPVPKKTKTVSFGGDVGDCYYCEDCTPSWSPWVPTAESLCEGVEDTQTSYDANACSGYPVDDAGNVYREQPVTGTKQPNWSEWVDYTTGAALDLDSKCVWQQVVAKRYDLNGCKEDNEYDAFYGTIPNSDPQCCNCHEGWSRTAPTCQAGEELKQEGAPDYMGLAGCDICYKCEPVECECPEGWSSAAPSSDVGTGLQCPEGETLKTAAGSGTNPCDTCYACAPEDACCCPSETGHDCPGCGSCCCGVYYAPVGIGCACAYVG